jgi:hypothetical protein
MTAKAETAAGRRMKPSSGHGRQCRAGKMKEQK